MKLSGWIFIMISWGFILGLATFCFSRIFKKGLDGEILSKKTKDKRGGKNK